MNRILAAVIVALLAGVVVGKRKDIFKLGSNWE